MNTVQINALLGAITLTVAGFALLYSQDGAQIADIPWLAIGAIMAASSLAAAIYWRRGVSRPAQVTKSKKVKR